eukprot:Colp12_sorted_trinity150504_noHs@27704
MANFLKFLKENPLVNEGRIAICGFGLGCTFVAGWAIYFFCDGWQAWGLYMAMLSFFHFSEYMTTALFNAKRLSLDSFLLNHSKEYQLAAVASWAEYFLERFLFPSFKEIRLITYVGFLIVLFGEGLRKTAMFTAGSNFSHIIQERKEESHQLVTEGVYSISRHPAYMGWFWWSVGTQVLLGNPLCTAAFAYASWQFFNDRIPYEEELLTRFFGQRYMEYKSRVSTGIPFIK